jgi:RNA polymerase sigma-70 factor (ECF subfamily)
VSSTDSSVDYAKLRQDFVRAVARICPRWLSSQRDDLVQAAIMRVMQIVSQRSAQGEGDAPFSSSYLYKVAYSALIDEMRRMTRRRETALEDENVTEVPGTSADPERSAASREIGQGIQDCLAELKSERRLAVTLYLQGHSVPEASRVLDWPAKRTENLVYRGLADLRECLTSKGIAP